MYDMSDEDLAATGNLDFDADEQPEPETGPHWQTPQALKNDLLPVLPLTPDMMPEPLRDWLTDIAYRMKCPLDFVASSAVVMLSALIGTRLTIKPKTRDDWAVVPNLWGSNIGGPSTKKTPAATEVFKPLNRLILAARAVFGDALAEYESALVEYEAQKKVHAEQAKERHRGKAVDKPVGYPEAPKKPKERRFMTNDATVEKLGELLNENPTGVLQYRDELIGLLAGWERAGRESDRAFYLEAWNGYGSKVDDRIGRGSTFVEYMCVSLFGGIQPAKLLPYLQAATGYENDGFVQRLQVAVYPDATPWEWCDDYPDKAARDRAFSLIQAVADSDFSLIGYDANEFDRYPYTRFDADAQDIFMQWYTNLNTQVLPNESGLLEEHFAKYGSLMPSLALIFHAVNIIDNPPPKPETSSKFLVSVDAAQMAVRWCNYLMSHARRIYGLLNTAPLEAAKELLRHLKAGDLKDGFKVRDVVQKGWSQLKTTEQATAAISELVACHYLHEVEPPDVTTGRPPAPYYLIHPNLLPNA